MIIRFIGKDLNNNSIKMGLVSLMNALQFDVVPHPQDCVHIKFIERDRLLAGEQEPYKLHAWEVKSTVLPQLEKVVACLLGNIDPNGMYVSCVNKEGNVQVDVEQLLAKSVKHPLVMVVHGDADENEYVTGGGSYSVPENDVYFIISPGLPQRHAEELSLVDFAVETLIDQYTPSQP